MLRIEGDRAADIAEFDYSDSFFGSQAASLGEAGRLSSKRISDSAATRQKEGNGYSLAGQRLRDHRVPERVRLRPRLRRLGSAAFLPDKMRAGFDFFPLPVYDGWNEWEKS
jgi:hypothetical protein